MSDYGFREYNTLLTRVLGAHDHNTIVSVCSRITEFVQDEDNNPVYSETLVNLLMHRAITVTEVLSHNTDAPTHDLMQIRRISRNVAATVAAWSVTQNRFNHEENL